MPDATTTCAAACRARQPADRRHLAGHAHLRLGRTHRGVRRRRRRGGRVIAALTRRAVLLGVAVVCVLATLPAQQPPPSPELTPAADTSAFRPGNIITDAVFYDAGAMNAAQVQAFLTQQGRNCTPASGGPACLKSYRHDDADPGRGRLLPGPLHRRHERDRRGDHRQGRRRLRDQPAGHPRHAPEGDQPGHAGGADRAPLRPGDGLRLRGQQNGGAAPYYPGLFKPDLLRGQAVQAVRRQPGQLRPRPGIVNNVRFHPNTACGSRRSDREQGDRGPVQLHALPAQRRPALAAGYGIGNSCSAYGNRNFWLYFTDWFGSTQTVGRDVDAPSAAWTPSAPA